MLNAHKVNATELIEDVKLKYASLLPFPNTFEMTLYIIIKTAKNKILLKFYGKMN